MMTIDRRAMLGGIVAAPIAFEAMIASAGAKEEPASLAEMMHKELMRRGVDVLPMDTANMREGMKIGAPPRHGGLWTQRHVDAPDETFISEVAVSILAGHIARYFHRIRFGYLFVPSGGVHEAARHNFSEVTLRSLSAYQSSVDENGNPVERLFRRVDVLFVGESR